MTGLISKSHAGCSVAFEGLIDAIRHPVRDFGNQIPLEDTREAFSKYKVWAGNVGAAHSGKRYEISLDYRLREASFLRDQVLNLLKALNEKLENAKLLLSGKRTPFEEFIEDSEEAVSDSPPSDVDEDDQDAESSPWDISSGSSSGSTGFHRVIEPTANFSPKKGLIAELGQAPLQEMPRLFASITFIIDCLYRIPIRKPAPLDRLKDKVLLESSLYQHFDMLYVRDKFPLLNADIANRLGKMITRRRELIYYQHAHAQNLHTHQVEPRLPLPTKSTSSGRQVAITQTASSHFTLHSKATTLLPGLFPVSSTQENMNLIALYPPSNTGSKSSLASSSTQEDLQIEIPPRPVGDNGEELECFECPYCLITKHITTKHKWKKHVLEDFQPYVCTYQNCDLGDNFFKNRDEWYEHESQHHRSTWYCNTSDHSQYGNQEDFINHMQKDHDPTFDKCRLGAVQDMFRQPSCRTEGICNLCMRESKKLKSHVAQHLQQIALFARPRVNETSGSGEAEHCTVSYKLSAEDVDEANTDDDDESGNIEEFFEIQTNDIEQEQEQEQEQNPGPHNLQNYGSTTFSPASMQTYRDKESQSSNGVTSKLSDTQEERSAESPLISINKVRNCADYQVAWICPVVNPNLLPARLMLDEEHRTPPYDTYFDENVYICGTINGHAIVIATCPQGETRNVNAGHLTESMSKTFPNIRMAVLVGIGSGIPRQEMSENALNNVHLGDVVVGWPGDGKPACVYHERGKLKPDGQFEMTGAIQNPDWRLISALSVLVSDYQLDLTKFDEQLARLERRGEGEIFAHPGREHDRLFKAAYRHVGNYGSKCTTCDQSELVQQPQRTEEDQYKLVFHLGRIATGNTVIQDGEVRDKISAKCDGALCIEMEAAGVDANIRCLVIRGISDYADSHKNDQWRSYAAGNAAVFTRELLCRVQIPTESVKSPAITMGVLTDDVLELKIPSNDGEKIVKVPKLGETWSAAEDEMLLRLVETMGSPKWKDVAQYFHRNDWACQNRYKKLVQRRRNL